ncbi:MAG TPA: glycosyltransferase N-terminal domain-containing protein [Gemmatimonadaceae bacterium]
MNAALRLAYGAVGQLARTAAALAPDGGPKWRRSLAARRGIRGRYAAWSRNRDLSRPLLWLHAPSVGEGLQARVVIEHVRQKRPDIQLAYTFFSPSAESFARTLPVDFSDYLPFDTPGDAAAVLNALRPTALVFSKLDVWPLLVEQAAERGVRLGLVSGTVSDASSREGLVATALLHESYASLDLVGAASDADAQRIISLGADPARVRVTGDTRYDQVWRRARNTDLRSAVLAPLVSTRPTLVAGSTWPADEEVLLAAWPEVKRDIPDARLVIAPHEPTPAHLSPIEAWAHGHGFALGRLGSENASRADVVLVDRTGVLGELYALATVAFVGGGFHGAGLHSVLEPAAFGVPVAFGPRHSNSREAVLLHRSRGGDSVATIDETIEALQVWLADSAARERAGAAAGALVERGLGAGERSYELVMELMFDGERSG